MLNHGTYQLAADDMTGGFTLPYFQIGASQTFVAPFILAERRWSYGHSMGQIFVFWVVFLSILTLSLNILKGTSMKFSFMH